MFRWQILLKFICMIRRRKKYKYFINTKSTEHKFEIIGSISKTCTFKATHKNVSQDLTQWRSQSCTIHLFIIITIKCEKWFFGGYVKEITKLMLSDFREILIATVQVVNTNVDGLIKQNISK